MDQCLAQVKVQSLWAFCAECECTNCEEYVIIKQFKKNVYSICCELLRFNLHGVVLIKSHSHKEYIEISPLQNFLELLIIISLKC